MSELFNQISEQAKLLNDAFRKAYKDGYEAGYKAKEKELLEEAEKDEAQLSQIEK
jgi:hypothetical protein